jgi:hypothetical protein
MPPIRELAYPEGHPAHPDFKGEMKETRFGPRFDYADDRAPRGGHGQPVPLQPGTSNVPRDGFRHLHGLDLSTLAAAEQQFAALPKEEQEQRQKWNQDGIPAQPKEG